MKPFIFDAWKCKNKVIAECRLKGACKPEFRKLKEAITEKEFMNVLWVNLWWVVTKKIFSGLEDIDYVGSSRFISDKGEFKNIYLKKKYKGTLDWWMDSDYNLVMPYVGEDGKSNHYKKSPPYYKY